MKHKIINGYTKESMKQKIREGNTGEVSRKDGACFYLKSDGNKCAVGCFIPEGHIGFNCGGDAYNLLDNNADLVYEMPLNAKGLITMQRLHDSYLSCSQSLHDRLFDFIDNECEE